MATDDQLAAILSTLQTLATNVIRLDTNLSILASRVEAESEADASFRREVRISLANLEAALAELSRDVAQIRERVVEVDTRADRRLKLLEANGANGHG